MNKDIFRPVEFWKSALMTMPDSSFFELLRCVFGKIKTPFNKQHLLKDLEMFLLRENIQKTIAAYIDENDTKVIAAVALFGEPVTGELESFFSGELSFAQLHDIIVNLEERFILYRFKEENKNRLALNPLLEQVLTPVAADISVLFPSAAGTSAETEATASTPILNDRILAGILSFVSQWQPFYRTEGVIRKQVIEAAKNTFPSIDFEFVLGGLQVLGLLYVDGDKLVPDKKHFCDFGSTSRGELSARERMEYCAAALLVYNEMKNTTEILPPLYKSRIREITNFIHGFLDSLDAEFLYTERTLKRLAEVLKARTGANTANDALLDTLEKTGLVVTVSPQQKRLGVIVHNTAEKHVPSVDSPFITVDSGLSILVYPEINYNDAIKLAAFLNIKEAGAVVRFELDKNSAIRAFDSGISADEIIELLGRLSGCKIDDSFLWNLKDWEKRHGEVSLKKGVVLTLAEDHRYLAATMPLTRLIDETLAPGIYLLGEDTMEQASAALRSAGIDIIAHRSSEKEDNELSFNYFPSPSSRAPEKIPFASASPVTKTSGSSQTANRAAALTEEFHTILNKMPIDKAEHDELSARIKRRLVLCEAQLKDANLRYEKLEAKHMDYAGKQNIARQAIAQQLPVEIVWPGAGAEKSIFGIPKALEKENGDLVLVVVCAGKEDVMRIPLAKVSLLRRIKKSIFET
ncbi:MAG: helicase-associated domain-containing protein [Treponema sp.]|jgi:hypothetical protein|nr:helicase-associated domain-containing protein [Treponema sp.]